MAWAELTQQAVKARLSKPEFEQYKASLKNQAEFDQVGEIISQVVALVRSKVRACKENIPGMGPAGTIPEECIFAAATIAKGSLCSSFPVAEGETDPRKEELRQAHAFLDSVASCSISIEGSNGGAIPGSSPVSYGGSPLLDFCQ